MAYTPPENDAVDFDFSGSAYTPPDSDAVDLEIPLPSGEGVVDCPAFEQTTEIETDYQIQASVADFENNNSLESEVHRLLTAEEFENTSDLSSDILWFASLPDLESASDLSSGVLWFTILSDLNTDTVLENPLVQLQVSVAPLESTTTLNSTNTRRIAGKEFEQNSELYVGYITEVPENTDVVGCWPFENNTWLDRPDVAFILETEFNSETDIPTPVIIANDYAGIVATDFENTTAFHIDLMPSIVLPDFNGNNELDVLAIKVMPAGDQYLVCPPFIGWTEMDIPSIQAGFPIPDFEQSTYISLSKIYSGFIVDTGEFEQTTSLAAVTYPVIVLTEFENTTVILTDIMPAISVPDFEQISILTADVQTGVFAEVPNFENNTRLEVTIPIVIPVQAFENINELELFTIASFIEPPELNTTTELTLRNIRLFSLENSTVYYYLVITGDGSTTEDIEVPFTSIQARRRNEAPTYLSVSIPGFDFAAEITDRIDNKIQVYMGYEIDSETSIRQLIMETDIETVDTYEGPTNKSITLIGYETIAYVQKTLSLEKPTYGAYVNGTQRYRFATPKVDLHPGDIVNINGDEIEVSVISLYIKNTKSGPISTMELESA